MSCQTRREKHKRTELQKRWKYIRTQNDTMWIFAKAKMTKMQYDDGQAMGWELKRATKKWRKNPVDSVEQHKKKQKIKIVKLKCCNTLNIRIIKRQQKIVKQNISCGSAEAIELMLLSCFPFPIPFRIILTSPAVHVHAYAQRKAHWQHWMLHFKCDFYKTNGINNHRLSEEEKNTCKKYELKLRQEVPVAVAKHTHTHKGKSNK